MTLDKILKDYILKPAIGLALVSGLYSCTSEQKYSKPISKEVQTKESAENAPKYSFDKWGVIDDFNKPTNIIVTDLDNDGDLDIIIGYTNPGLNDGTIIYENKIPQKNKPTQ